MMAAFEYLTAHYKEKTNEKQGFYNNSNKK